MIALTRAQRDAMVAYARSQAPLEACGLLGGVATGGRKIVRQVYFLMNADASGSRFSMRPEEQFAAIRDMRRKGWEPLGCFHSHPAAPARPSREDRRLARDAEASYVILSLAEEPPMLACFRSDGRGGMEPEKIAVLALGEQPSMLP